MRRRRGGVLHTLRDILGVGKVDKKQNSERCFRRFVRCVLGGGLLFLLTKNHLGRIQDIYVVRVYIGFRGLLFRFKTLFEKSRSYH